jgi:hypothetical protein
MLYLGRKTLLHSIERASQSCRYVRRLRCLLMLALRAWECLLHLHENEIGAEFTHVSNPLIYPPCQSICDDQTNSRDLTTTPPSCASERRHAGWPACGKRDPHQAGTQSPAMQFLCSEAIKGVGSDFRSLLLAEQPSSHHPIPLSSPHLVHSNASVQTICATMTCSTSRCRLSCARCWRVPLIHQSQLVWGEEQTPRI